MARWVSIAVAIVLTATSALAQINTSQVMNLGRNALWGHDYWLAIQYFNQVIYQEPTLAEPYYYRAVAKMALGDCKGANDDATQCININPFINNSHKLRAIARQQSHNYQLAIEDYNKCREVNKDDHDILLNIASCHIALEEYAQADSCLKELLSNDSTNASVHLAIAQLRLEQHDTLATINHLSQAIKLNKNNAKARLKLNQLLHSTGHTGNDINDIDNKFYSEHSDIINQGDLYPELSFRSDDFINERKAVEQRIQHGPLFIRDNYLVNVKPQEIFRLSYYPDDILPQGHTHLTKEMSAINDMGALPCKLTIVSRARHLSAYEAADRFASVAHYNDIIKNDKTHAINFFARAMDQLMLRNYDAAIQDASSAIAIKPGFTLAYMLRFNASCLKLETEEQYNETSSSQEHSTFSGPHATSPSSDINTVIKLSPNNSYAIYNLAHRQAVVNDFENALTNYSRAIELNPHLGEAYFNRGLIYLQLGQREKAIDDLSKAGELGIMDSYSILKKIITSR